MSFEASTMRADVMARQQPLPALAIDAKARRNRRFSRELLQLVSMAIVGFASYFLFSHFVVCSVQVQGISMAPTLQDAQRYLLNRWIFHVRPPRASEVIVIRDPVDNGFSVKRIVGLPGDSVLVQDGKVFVNGREIAEAYLPKLTKTFPTANLREQLLVCGEHEYVVLGDNRNNSADSRAYGPVSRDRIVGLVVR